jgi:hypothetical protein
MRFFLILILTGSFGTVPDTGTFVTNEECLEFLKSTCSYSGMASPDETLDQKPKPFDDDEDAN